MSNKKSSNLKLILATSFILLFGVVGFYIYAKQQPTTSNDVATSTTPTVVARDPNTKYLEFLAMGDFGTGGAGQMQVAESLSKVAASEPASFVLLLGDNFYEDGVESVEDPQWKTKFEDVYNKPGLNIPFYAVLGNHDYRKNPQAEVDYTKKSKKWRMPDKYYTFTETVDDKTQVQFFCLDSTPLVEMRSTNDLENIKKMVQWLEQQLQSSTSRWKIVAAHHPLYSNGPHGDSGVMINVFEPILEKYKVDFYICGHDHSLQLLKPIKGVRHIVSGGGGKITPVRYASNTEFAATNLGFARLRISNSDTTITFYDKDGKTSYATTVKK
ncbi:MAG: metallophosphoesterase [Blastocatellia bacterium]|nr:metallophosphoesterase [Blastocatellia bacterium]